MVQIAKRLVQSKRNTWIISGWIKINNREFNSIILEFNHSIVSSYKILTPFLRLFPSLVRFTRPGYTMHDIQDYKTINII